MIDPKLYTLFLLSAIILLLTPGPAVLYITSRSIEQGKQAGFASVLGISIGTLLHILATTCGLSLLVMKSPILFNAIKVIGAGYLVYLGLKTYLQKQVFNFDNVGSSQANLKKVFVDGIIVNTFNPKAIIFFLAFIPQFLNLDYGHIAMQTLFYGISFLVLAISSDIMYVLMSQPLRRFLQRSKNFQKYQKYIVGSIYVALGVLTLFTNV